MLRRRPAAERHLPPGVEETPCKPKENLWNKWGHAAPATAAEGRLPPGERNYRKTNEKLRNKWEHAAPATGCRKTFATGNKGNLGKTFGDY